MIFFLIILLSFLYISDKATPPATVVIAIGVLYFLKNLDIENPILIILFLIF